MPENTHIHVHTRRISVSPTYVSRTSRPTLSDPTTEGEALYAAPHPKGKRKEHRRPWNCRAAQYRHILAPIVHWTRLDSKYSLRSCSPATDLTSSTFERGASAPVPAARHQEVAREQRAYTEAYLSSLHHALDLERRTTGICAILSNTASSLNSGTQLTELGRSSNST